MRGPTGANEKVPLGQLPIVELPNGDVRCQLIPILRWACRHSDLYPDDRNQALLCDEVVESVAELRSKIPNSKDLAEQKKLREEFIAHVLPKYMDYLTRRLQNSGGPFLLGNQFCMADLFLGRIIDGFVEKKFDPISKETFEKWPLILQHLEATRRHPIYAAELKAEEEYQKSRKAAL